MANQKRGRALLPTSITINPDTFVVGYRVAQAVRFDEIVDAALFKQDLLSVDDVLCEIHYVQDGRDLCWTVDDGMPGFWDLLERLSSMPGGVEGWWETVVIAQTGKGPFYIYRRPHPHADAR